MIGLMLRSKNGSHHKHDEIGLGACTLSFERKRREIGGELEAVMSMTKMMT